MPEHENTHNKLKRKKTLNITIGNDKKRWKFQNEKQKYKAEKKYYL